MHHFGYRNHPDRRYLQGKVCVDVDRSDFLVYSVEKLIDLGERLALTPMQRGQRIGLQPFCDSEIEPSPHFLFAKVAGPSVEGKLDDLLVDVDEARVGQCPFGEFTVHAHGLVEPVHGIQQAICPLHEMRVTWQSSIVGARREVDLHLLHEAVLRFEMAGTGGQLRGGTGLETKTYR